eukprot:COSAG02_NODE_3320_length_6947_cov_4.871349_6_plen_65_part_00
MCGALGGLPSSIVSLSAIFQAISFFLSTGCKSICQTSATRDQLINGAPAVQDIGRHAFEAVGCQ